MRKRPTHMAPHQILHGLMAFAAVLWLTATPALATSYQPEPPRLPRFLADTVAPDAMLLGDYADAYHQSGTARARTTPEHFLFAHLPARLFAKIISGDLGPDEAPEVFGLLYVSGWEGGVWLNDALRRGGGKGIGVPGRLTRTPVQLFIGRRASRALKLIEKGTAGRKQKALLNSFDLLAMSYGYNRGYLEEILRRPPPGSEIAPDYFACEGLLDCAYPDEGAEAIQPLAGVRAKLEDPPDGGWAELSARLEDGLPSATARGEGVWTGIMSDAEMGGDDYQALVDVSCTFLALNEAALLLSARALAEGDEDDVDRALLADAALTVWLGAYVIGLGER